MRAALVKAGHHAERSREPECLKLSVYVQTFACITEKRYHSSQRSTERRTLQKQPAPPSLVQSLQEVVSASDLDVRSGILDEDALDGVVLSDSYVTLRSWSTKESASIEQKTNSSSEGGGVICQEVDLGVLGSELLLPCLGGECVVDCHDVDVLDSLCCELFGILNVAWDVGAAWWSECSWNTDDEVWPGDGRRASSQYSDWRAALLQRPLVVLTLASKLAKVDTSLLRVVLLEHVAGWDRAALLDCWGVVSELVLELCV